MKTWYAGIDIGSRKFDMAILGRNEEAPAWMGQGTTGEFRLRQCVRDGRRACKGRMILAVEEGELAQWMLGILRDEVDEMRIVDPKLNAWIARDRHKNDRVDALKLARLLAGGYVRNVYHAEDADRVEFKRAVQNYDQMTRLVAGVKCRIKAKLRAEGHLLGDFAGGRPLERDSALQALGEGVQQEIVRQLMNMLEALEKARSEARGLMRSLGRNYPEVVRFEKVPGIGPVGACTFSAYIQTPARFRNKRALWRYCGLSIADRKSDGKPLGYKKIERNGVGALKTVSYLAFCSCQKGDNEFSRTFRASLRRTENKTHARLNTQRKILAVLYGMWKRNEAYLPEEKRIEKVRA